MNKRHISLVCVSLCLAVQVVAEEHINSSLVNEEVIGTTPAFESVVEMRKEAEPLQERLEFTISPVDSSNLLDLEKKSEVAVIPEGDSSEETLASKVAFDLHLPGTFIAEQETKQSSDENDADLTPIFCLLENINLLGNSDLAIQSKPNAVEEVVAVIQEPLNAEIKPAKADVQPNNTFGIVPAITTLANNRVDAGKTSPSFIISQEVIAVEDRPEITAGDADIDVVVVNEELIVDPTVITEAADHSLNHTIEFRGAAFFPASKRFREVYGHAGGNYQIEASTKVTSAVEGWVNLDWYMRDRHLVDSCRSRVKLANLSIGLKYVHTFTDYLDGYLGIGPSFGWLSIHNRTWFSSQRRSRFALGAVFKSGLRIYITKNLFLDLFADYLAERVHFNNHHVQIGGLKTGLGFGVRF